MDPKLREIGIGALVGVLIVAMTYIFLGGKRDELKSLEAQIISLQKEVDRGRQLKANYERLKIEIAEQERMIEQLIRLMPTDTDKGEVPYRIKKLADNASIDQISFKEEAPIKSEFYTEYPFTFTFKAGYHGFGQFASHVSGYDKIINVKEMQMKREANKKNSIFPVAVTCRISAFVYNPEPPAGQASGAPSASGAPKPQGKTGGDDL